MARKLCVRNYSSSVQEPKNSVKIFVFKLLLFKRQFHNVSWMNWNKQVEGSEWSGRDGNFLRDLELLRSLSSRLTPVTQPTPRPTYCVEEAARFDRAVTYLPMRCPGNTKPVERLIFTIKLVPTNITISNSFQIQYSFQHTKVTSECRTIWQRNLEEL